MLFHLTLNQSHFVFAYFANRTNNVYHSSGQGLHSTMVFLMFFGLLKTIFMIIHFDTLHC